MKPIISVFLFLAVFMLFIELPVYAENGPEHYVVEKPGYFILRSNHLPDFYISKDGFQISNNLTDRWAEIQVGLNLSICKAAGCSNISKWTRGLAFNWKPMNYSNAANVTGKYVIWKRNERHVTLYLNYHIDNSSGYMRIRPYLNFSLPPSIWLENVVYTYRMENVSLDGPENDFLVFPKNNGTELELPVYGTFEYNYSKHGSQYGFLDNVTGKFLEYVWNRDFYYRNTTKFLNRTIGRAMGRTFQIEYYYPGRVQGEGLFYQDWFWLDPTTERNKYYRTDTHTLCSYTMEKLFDSRSGSSGSISKVQGDPESEIMGAQWGTGVYINYCNGTSQLIGDKIAKVTRYSVGAGIQSSTWRPGQNYTIYENSTLATRIYVRFYYFHSGYRPPYWWSGWYEIDSNYRWQTDALGGVKLLGCAGAACPPPPVWNFYYYTTLTHQAGPPETWTAFFKFDTSTFNSRIFNITIELPVVGAWNHVETWTGNLITRSWEFVESWTGLLITRSWSLVEYWTGIFITRSWNLVEIWTGLFGEAEYEYLIPILFLSGLVASIGVLTLTWKSYRNV